MRAASYTTQGPARSVLRVGAVPEPRPGPGQLRVRIHYSAINRTDIYARQGSHGRAMAADFVVPHQDGSGVVDAVGEGVPAERIGQAVWLFMAQTDGRHGTAAEWTVVDASRAAPLPEGLGFAEGACLGIPWLTAHRAVSLAVRGAGATVLVAGATGAVGYYAVQIAKADGARVIATVGSDEKAGLARAAGADETIDFRRDDVAGRVAALTGGAGVDGVIESQLAANVELLPEVLARSGIVAVYGSGGPTACLPTGWALRHQATIQFIYVYDLTDDARSAAIASLTELAGAGGLAHLPVREFPLERIADAHEAMEDGNRGSRVVLRLAD